MTSTINLYELGQTPPSDGWLVSDWTHFSSIMDWSAGNVRSDAGGVRLTLDEAPGGSAKPYQGGEIQSDAVAVTGTFTWTAKAPDLVPGAVFGMFAFQADHDDPRAEYDFEFVKGRTDQIWLVVHMAGPNGQVVSSPGRTVDLGFDAAKGFHTYKTVVTAFDEAAFLVDGKVIGYFSAADLPGQAWQTGPLRSYANLWATDRGWAGKWLGLDEPVAATLRGADVEAGTFAGIVQVNGTAGADRIVGTVLQEIIRGGVGDDSLSGGRGNDFLRGGKGHDVLDGGTGTDRLEGGGGHDTFVLATAGDAVVELAGGGADQVRSAVSHVLAPNVENLALTGSAAVNGSGNELGNRVNGNAAANALYGGAGNDLLQGGGGQDRLEGDGGNDQLRGNEGRDSFRFEAGRDRVLDFRDNADTLLFDDALWGGGARSAARILEHANLSGGDAVFDFGGGQVLVVENVRSLGALADDVGWF